MPQRNLAVILLVGVASILCHQKAPASRYVRTLSHAMGIIHGLYVEDVPSQQLFEDAMAGMVGGLDPYSAFITTDSFQQFQESLDQEFGGIGIVVEGPPRTERLTIVTPIVNTPAYEAGLQAGDVILEVDGTTTEGMRVDEAVTLMRGPRGQAVELLVRHSDGGEPRSYSLKRDLIPIESVLGDTRTVDGDWDFHLEEDPRLAYVRVTSFGEHTARDLAAALESCGPVQGLILDLRGNAGGLLKSAVETCDMFIDQGDIVSTRGRGGVVRQRYEATRKLRLPREVPIVVLTNRGSASASEIVAACLKDHDRAKVVGERSWGKGTVQNIIELEGGRSALKLTTASYWRPNGHNIHRTSEATEDDEWGVRPSEGFEVRMTDEQLRQAVAVRRRRDIVPGKRPRPAGSVENPGGDPAESGSQSGAESSSQPDADRGQGAAGEPGADEPAADGSDFDDPQVRRAIEYLQSLLPAADDH
ncbi:MAG: S41 family peptidase [Pirellulaceae bacterium]|nr:S41 family peptidase [Pirellulaceae bacterium]